MATQIPLEGGSNGYITVPGRDDAALKNQLFEWNFVTSDYFRAFGIPILQGRIFTEQDQDHGAVVAQRVAEMSASANPDRGALQGLSWPVVVNATMARLVWPRQDPIGKTFEMWAGLTAHVIGVAADVKVRGIRSDVVPQA
jgi:hypothetical protein